MPDQPDPTTAAQGGSSPSPLLGVSRFALERAMSALEYQISRVKESPDLNGHSLIGAMMREGLSNAEKALEEVRAALFA